MEESMETRLDDCDLVSLAASFLTIPEYRKNLLNIEHRLIDIIAISVCGVIAGAEGPSDIFNWAEVHQQKLITILKLENGIPSRDTIRRTLEAIKPEVFQKCFLEWLAMFREKNALDKEHIAIDGKTLRRSHDRKKCLGALHIVSAWSSEQGISLGQLATEEKSNEITAIPELLDSIDIEGAVVTIDAMGTQVKIAEKIIEKKAGYVLAVKDNQPKLNQAVVEYFQSVDLTSKKVSHVVEEETSHGRVEHREYFQTTIPEDFPESKRWPGIKTIGMVIRTHRKTGGEKETTETRYYISSERRNGKDFARYVRKHWGIENSLHWVMDMTFREDESRVRERTIADNLSWIRRFTVTLIKQNSRKGSIVAKRKKAAWSFDFLLELIQGTQDQTEKQGR
jgi:predicted transposase YbfD/YdcC